MKNFQTKLKKAKKDFFLAVQKYRIEFGLRLTSDNFCRQIYVKKADHIFYRQDIPLYFRKADKKLKDLQHYYKHRKLNRRKRKKNYLLRLKYYGRYLSAKMKRQIWKQQVGINILWKQ